MTIDVRLGRAEASLPPKRDAGPEWDLRVLHEHELDRLVHLIGKAEMSKEEAGEAEALLAPAAEAVRVDWRAPAAEQLEKVAEPEERVWALNQHAIDHCGRELFRHTDGFSVAAWFETKRADLPEHERLGERSRRASLVTMRN